MSVGPTSSSWAGLDCVRWWSQTGESGVISSRLRKPLCEELNRHQQRVVYTRLPFCLRDGSILHSQRYTSSCNPRHSLSLTSIKHDLLPHNSSFLIGVVAPTLEVSTLTLLGM